MTIPTRVPSPEVIAALGGSWFGARLGPEAVARLAALARFRDVAAGTELTREGDQTEALWIVLSGRVALRMLVPERGMITILTIEAGDIMGWSTVVPPHRSTAQSVVIDAGRLLVLPGPELRAMLATDHELAARFYPQVLFTVARRLDATRLQVLDLFAREDWGRREIQPW
jgi:CRP/FNR family cyclic AMP-dependent transcriptional regulator